MKKAGFTLIEVVIVMGILATAIIPLYQLIVNGSLNVTKAKFSYIALNLTREKMEEMISRPWNQIKSEATWTKIEGPVVSEELLKMSSRKTSSHRRISSRSLSGGFSGGSRIGFSNVGKSVIDSDVEISKGDYPADYRRFERRVIVTKKGKRLKHIMVEVRWYEKGEKDLRQNHYLYSLNSLVGNHHLSSYK